MALRSGWLQGDILVLIAVFAVAVLALASTMNWGSESTPRAFVTGNFVYSVTGDDLSRTEAQESVPHAISGKFCCSKLWISKHDGCPANPVAAVPECVPATTAGCGSWVGC